MKKKKIIVSIAITIIVASLIYLFLAINGVVPMISLRDLFGSDDNELVGLEKIKEIISTTHPTDIVVIGDDISFSVEVETRKIEKIDNSTLQRRDGCEYTVVVVNDLDNKVQLTEDEQELLRKNLKEYGFCLIYLGEKYSSTWNSEDELPVYIKGNLFYGYYSVSGVQSGTVGAWMAEDQEQLETYPNSLGETILYFIESFLREIG